MSDNHRVAGTFISQVELERALFHLRETGFDMNKVSLLAKDEVHQPETIAGVEVSDKVGNQSGEGASTGAVTGGLAGGLTGLLVGIGALAIPGIGPVMTAGAIGTAIASAVSGGAIGAAAGGLTGALVGMGIPEERSSDYGNVIDNGGYLVFVDGRDEEVQQAGKILQDRGMQHYSYYPATVLRSFPNT